MQLSILQAEVSTDSYPLFADLRAVNIQFDVYKKAILKLFNYIQNESAKVQSDILLFFSFLRKSLIDNERHLPSSRKATTIWLVTSYSEFHIAISVLPSRRF